MYYGRTAAIKYPTPSVAPSAPIGLAQGTSAGSSIGLRRDSPNQASSWSGYAGAQVSSGQRSTYGPVLQNHTLFEVLYFMLAKYQNYTLFMHFFQPNTFKKTFS